MSCCHGNKPNLTQIRDMLVEMNDNLKGMTGSVNDVQTELELFKPIVPSYNGQKIKRDPNITGLRLIIIARNETNEPLDFTNVSPEDTFQIWQNYHTLVGTIAKPSTSTVFNPENKIIAHSPAGSVVYLGDTFQIDVILENLHFEIQQNPGDPYVIAWSVFVRMILPTTGTTNFGRNLPIVSYYATPFYTI